VCIFSWLLCGWWSVPEQSIAWKETCFGNSLTCNMSSGTFVRTKFRGCIRNVAVRDREKTETFDFRSETRPRLRPSKIFSRPRRDRDLRFSDRDETETETLPDLLETETFQNSVSKPRLRDRDFMLSANSLTYSTLVPFRLFSVFYAYFSALPDRPCLMIID